MRQSKPERTRTPKKDSDIRGAGQLRMHLIRHGELILRSKSIAPVLSSSEWSEDPERSRTKRASDGSADPNGGEGKGQLSCGGKAPIT